MKQRWKCDTFHVYITFTSNKNLTRFLFKPNNRDINSFEPIIMVNINIWHLMAD